ncbi:MAG TPA: hypothetical protein VF516_13805, partial [Kofleriaceae bacterium]
GGRLAGACEDDRDEQEPGFHGRRILRHGGPDRQGFPITPARLARTIHHAAGCDRRGAGISGCTAGSRSSSTSSTILTALPGVRPVPLCPLEILRDHAIAFTMKITTCR